MYNGLSTAFKTAMKDPQRVEHVRGYIGAEAFTDNNVLTMNYSNACSDSKDVTFGMARIGQLTATFRGVNIARTFWRGLAIILDYGLEIDDQHTTEWVPVGVFTIGQADWTDTGINVTAYDVISRLDKLFGMSTTNGTIYDLLELVANDTNTQNGRTRSECVALPNGTELLGLFAQNDISTYRDFCGWLGSTVGGFMTASRDGKLQLKSFAESEVVDSFVSRDRIVGSVFSDYTTHYSGVSIQDADTNSVLYYDVPGAQGGNISLGSNPLLQYGTTETKERQRMTLAEVANGIQYTPFNIAILNCPVYDLGDLVECSGGVAGAGTLTCCIMAIDWTLKNTLTMQGFGADPNLTAGKSSTDKALQGLKSKTSENEMIIHTYENAQAYNLGNGDDEEVIKIDFATIKPKTVLTLSEINFDLDITDASGIATVTAYYYLNGTLEAYQPVGSWNNDGKHILSLMYPLVNLMSGGTYEWTVVLEVNGGTATIARGDVHSILEGQGLVAINDFNGEIEIIDAFVDISALRTLAQLAEDLSVDNYAFEDVSLHDLVTNYTAGARMTSLTESMQVDFFGEPSEPMITEDGQDLITEDGDAYYTEGE